MKRSKRYVANLEKLDKNKAYSVEEAVKLVKETSNSKFDGTVEVAMNLNLDTKKNDQQLRGAVVLPNGTGKSKKILVLAKGDQAKAAKEAGYDIKVGKFPFIASGKASAAGATDGFVKVIFDAKYGEFLGCHMIGTNVTEMIAEAVVERKLETTAHELLNA